jgi:amino acid transporter
MLHLFSVKPLDLILQKTIGHKHSLRRVLMLIQITLLSGIAVGTAAKFLSLEIMVDLAKIGTLFAFILVCMSEVVLRFKDPNRPRPFRMRGGMFMPFFWILGCLTLIYYLPSTSGLRFTIWLIVGFLIYIGHGNNHSKLANQSLKENQFLQGVDSAYASICLGIFGLLLLFLARIADIIQGDGNLFTGLFSQNSWWLSIPLLLNNLILYLLLLFKTLPIKKDVFSVQ